MSHKLCIFLIAILSISLVYFIFENNHNYESKTALSDTLEDQKKEYEALKKEKQALITEKINELISQGLLMPDGLDQHYERIRNYESQAFINKGDEGRLAFYVTQVLHDLGKYNYTQRYDEFLSDIGVSCSNLTIEFSSNFINYINQEAVLLNKSNSGVSELQIIYEWVNSYVGYRNDTGGFPRFPVETLTYRFGDCEDQAMALSYLLESEGYETVLVSIHDENLTKYGEDGLQHAFCVVKKENFDYNGTLIQLKEYQNYGNVWIILDSAYNQNFGEEPEWLVNYKTDEGFISIPSELYNSLRVDYTDVERRLRDLEILS